MSQRKQTLAEPAATVSVAGAQREASPAQQMRAPSRDAPVFPTHNRKNVGRSWWIRLIDGGDICVLGVNSCPCKQSTRQEQLTLAHWVQQYRKTKSARRATENPGSLLSSLLLYDGGLSLPTSRTPAQPRSPLQCAQAVLFCRQLRIRG